MNIELPRGNLTSAGCVPELIPSGRFEPLRPRDDCPHCRGSGANPRVVDAVYCMSLVGEEERLARVENHLHAIGLCRGAVFYRTERHPEGRIGSWYSHKAIAQESLARGLQRVLILEDDILFLVDWATIARRVERVLAKIPASWRVLYLGHKPFRAYPVKRGLFRVSSYLAHAYIANRPALEWLAAEKPGDPTIPSDHPYMDPGFCVMTEMYALFPMVAKPVMLRWPKVTSWHGLRALLREGRVGADFVNQYLFRAIEIAAVLASPFQRRFFTRPPVYDIYMTDTQRARDARTIRAAQAFDDHFYLREYPNVFPCDPLRHYIFDGARQGRRPNVWFDTQAYVRQHPELATTQENPLAHYLRHAAPAAAPPS